MKYKDFLNESRGYKDFSNAQECREYLEKYCLISWNYFKEHGNTGLWRGIGLASRAGEMTICNPVSRGSRTSVSGNVLTNWIWNKNCDDKKYFNRDVSIMVSCNIYHVEEFGYPCNVFLQDDALLNATESDFMLSNVDDIFNVRNPKRMTIASFENAISASIYNIANELDNYTILYAVKKLRDNKRKISANEYYTGLQDCWADLKFILNAMEKTEYRQFINKSLSKEVTTFFNSNEIGINDIWNIFDININKNSVKSLNVESLYKGLDYDEVWTQSPVVICSGHGIKKLSNL